MSIEIFVVNLATAKRKASVSSYGEPIKPGEEITLANFNPEAKLVATHIVCDTDDSEGRYYELDPELYSFTFDDDNKLVMQVTDDERANFPMEHSRTITERSPVDIFIRDSRGKWMNKVLVLRHRRTLKDL